MFGRKFGVDIQNLVKEKSSNHIVLKSRSFSFDGKSKAPSHITRKSSFVDDKQNLNSIKTPASTALIVDQASPNLLQTIQNDHQIVPQFLKQCIKHMRNKQINKKPFIDQIRLINPTYYARRPIIIDWIVGIHYQLKLFPQTLFIAISYMDQYSSKVPVQDKQLYMLAATCIFIAGKYQETYRIPCIRSIQQASDQPLQKDEMIKMESKVMDALEFKLIVDTSIKYLQLYSKMINLSQKNFYIAQYILQLSLTDITFLEFSSSLMGSAVQYLVNKIRKISPPWASDFKQLTSYDESDLKTCAKNLCSLLEKSQQLQNTKNIRTKFAKAQFSNAANIRLQRKNQ